VVRALREGQERGDDMFERTEKGAKEPAAAPVPAEETEVRLLEQFATRQEAVEEAAWEVIAYYAGTGQQSRALPYVERLLATTEDPGTRGDVYLALGQLMEQVPDYGAAIEAYTKALALEPADQTTWYFVNNNLGYCLNHVGRHAEAEAHCRAAIQVDPERHNAHKNLGIALEGQGRLAEAVRAYLVAARLRPEDRRSLRHLDDLLMRHPEMIPLPEPERN
jgi:tetratricopeptide (TPR) repeat protein